MSRFLRFNNKTYQVGDTVKVGYKIKEFVKGKEKERVQDFEGILTKVRGMDENKTFTVRKVSKSGIGVERIFPVMSPWIAYIKLTRKSTYARAKAFFVRDLSDSNIRRKLYRSK
ncbi:MAG: hypothetical protein KatS3mg091_353 [Patescibacteria group bacterium]|nr:MAG: hypothetical protein KatS3mg091_353 [Patescibacteria group bacterium]